LRKAWALVKIQALQTAMSTGIVTITFRKLSGELTTRQATRSLDLIPSEHHPRNGSRAYTPDLFLLPFYSLTDGGWRSLTAQGVVSFKLSNINPAQ